MTSPHAAARAAGMTAPVPGGEAAMSANPCGHATRHTSRIGCCSGCRRLFSSDSAHDRHRREHRCLAPESVGMVAKPSRTAPGEVIWGMPGGDWR